jgi:hypothetical protein
VHDPEISGNKARQKITVREGLNSDQCREIVKAVKASKTKVQAAIQGDMVRISGKKRDDLQQTIALVKGMKLGMPLQYKNFRD